MKSRSGFSALLSLLLLTACSRGRPYQGRSQVDQEMRQIAQTVEVFVYDQGKIPGTRTAEIVKAITSGGRSWYVHDPKRIRDGQLLDPWGYPYRIVVSEEAVSVASSNGRATFDPEQALVVFREFGSMTPPANPQ